VRGEGVNLWTWFSSYHWTYDFDIDPALYAWRVRWFEPENNPFRSQS
jgi:hypothetical protein